MKFKPNSELGPAGVAFMYKEPPGCPSVPHTEQRRLGGVHQRRDPHPHPRLPAQRQHLLGLVLPVLPGLPTWGRSGRGGSVTGAQAHTHPPAASITDGQVTLHRFLPLLGLVCAPGPLGPGGHDPEPHTLLALGKPPNMESEVWLCPAAPRPQSWAFLWFRSSHSLDLRGAGPAGLLEARFPCRACSPVGGC